MTVITEDAFRSEASAFLDANAERRVEEKFEWGKGSDRVGVLDEKSPEQQVDVNAAAKRWKAQEFDAGFGWITGPEAFGGRALPTSYERVPRARRRLRDPGLALFTIGLGMVAPTILAHAIPGGEGALPVTAVPGRSRGVPALLRSRSPAPTWPASRRAERDGDEWIVTGQKVWTSGAQYSDIGEIITRTSPDKPKHKGLTMFLVDMKAPGVEVRPLRQMTGGASFNEVFFTEVRVPDSHRLGDVDEGWGVALTTLMNERARSAAVAARARSASPASVRWSGTLVSTTTRSCANGSPTSTCAPTSRDSRAFGEWPKSARAKPRAPRCRSASSRSRRTCR